jgi:small subunit ribosomal protein S19e
MSLKSTAVKDVPADQFIATLAAHFKKTGKLNVPAWSDMVKTGCARELAPVDPDWFYVRAAALARKVYLFPNRGVGSYAKVYGGAQDNGAMTQHHRKAATSVIRAALQSLEKLGLVETAEKGRKITSKGQTELDTIANSISKKGGVQSVWTSY